MYSTIAVVEMLSSPFPSSPTLITPWGGPCDVPVGTQCLSFAETDDTVPNESESNGDSNYEDGACRLPIDSTSLKCFQ